MGTIESLLVCVADLCINTQNLRGHGYMGEKEISRHDAQGPVAVFGGLGTGRIN